MASKKRAHLNSAKEAWKKALGPKFSKQIDKKFNKLGKENKSGLTKSESKSFKKSVKGSKGFLTS